MPTATSMGFMGFTATASVIGHPAGVIARELPRHAARARTTLQGPAQRFRTRAVDLLRRAAEAGQPMRADAEVIVLPERIERDPQAEPFGQRDFLFDRFPGMQVAIVTMLVA